MQGVVVMATVMTTIDGSDNFGGDNGGLKDGDSNEGFEEQPAARSRNNL